MLFNCHHLQDGANVYTYDTGALPWLNELYIKYLEAHPAQGKCYINIYYYFIIIIAKDIQGIVLFAIVDKKKKERLRLFSLPTRNFTI